MYAPEAASNFGQGGTLSAVGVLSRGTVRPVLPHHFLSRGTRMTVDALLGSVMARIGTRTLAAGVGFTLCVSGVIALAQANAAALEVLQIRPNFYMIVGAGANIGAQIGPNGVVLVNAGTAEASGEVVAAVAKLTNQPIRYIIDTSADPDVVGGNAKIASAGRNITSFAVRTAVG